MKMKHIRDYADAAQVMTTCVLDRTQKILNKLIDLAVIGEVRYVCQLEPEEVGLMIGLANEYYSLSEGVILIEIGCARIALVRGPGDTAYAAEKMKYPAYKKPASGPYDISSRQDWLSAHPEAGWGGYNPTALPEGINPEMVYYILSGESGPAAEEDVAKIKAVADICGGTYEEEGDVVAFHFEDRTYRVTVKP